MPRPMEYPDKMLVRLPPDAFRRVDSITGDPKRRGETLRRWILERLEMEERENPRRIVTAA
jgi:hypothetical protein